MPAGSGWLIWLPPLREASPRSRARSHARQRCSPSGCADPLHGRHTQGAGPRAAKGRTGRSRRVPTSHAGNKGAEGKRCPERCSKTGGPRREERHSGIAASPTQERASNLARQIFAGARSSSTDVRRRAPDPPARVLQRSATSASAFACKRRLLLLLHEGWKPAGPRRRSARERAGGSACDSPAVCPQTACSLGRVHTARQRRMLIQICRDAPGHTRVIFSNGCA